MPAACGPHLNPSCASSPRLAQSHIYRQELFQDPGDYLHSPKTESSLHCSLCHSWMRSFTLYSFDPHILSPSDMPGTGDTDVITNIRVLSRRSSLFRTGLLSLGTTAMWGHTIVAESSPVRCRTLSTIPASTHYMAVAAPSVTTENIWRHCQNPVGGKLENYCSSRRHRHISWWL